MNPANIRNIEELSADVESEKLFDKLTAQVEKDFALASAELDLDVDEKNSAKKLFQQVANSVYHLISFKTETYLNLLYIVDVPEQAIKQLQTDDVAEFAKAVSFLILKRCWMKVWYKAKY